MSDKSRRGWLLPAACIATQALAFGALAQQNPSQQYPSQQTEESMPARTDTTRTTQSHTTQSQAHAAQSHAASGEHSGAMKNVSPQAFVKQAAVIGKAEIELGQLAIQKSQDQDVRAYAQRMVKDHEAADAQLKKIAAQENLQVPQALDAEHQAVKQKLSSLSGAAFDREYKKEMAKGHNKAVALFESASQAAQMPSDLKEFAAATLPTLQEHKEQAHSLEKKGA